MTHSSDFEHLFELDNVNAVEYDEENDRVVTFVTEKVSEEDIDETQLVAQNLEKEHDVVELGEVKPLDVPEAQGEPSEKHRPVVAGVSEMNADGTAGTAGPYPARVNDTSKGEWADSVEEGDFVRLSNNHVYAKKNAADFGEAILQPSPYDGGSAKNQTGSLAGYVPVGEGATVDVAARTVTEDRESSKTHELPDDWPTGVRTEGYEGLKGTTLVKSGRTTGVKKGDVKATSASVRINYGGDTGVITLRDLIVTGFMSEGGDSGSPTFVNETGELVGQLFGGSSKATIHHKMQNVEEELGVTIMTEENTEDDGSEKGDNERAVSLETTVSIDMEKKNLDLEGLSGDKPKQSESVETTVSFSGNYTGNCWLEVQDEEHTFELTEEDEKDGRYEKDVVVELDAPDEYRDEFEVTFKGGYE